IEYHSVAGDKIGRLEHAAQIGRSAPSRRLDVAVPCLERLLGVGMQSPEIAQRLLGDDPHWSSYSAPTVGATSIASSCSRFAHADLLAQFVRVPSRRGVRGPAAGR